MNTTTLFISVVIPSFERRSYMIDTVSALLRQEYPAYEILIVDQTPGDALRPEEVWPTAGERVRYYSLSHPSVPGALNKGIAEARGDIILFLDDDIIPSEGLLAAHAERYADPAVGVVQGRITDKIRHDPTPGPLGCLERNGHTWGNHATSQPTTPIRATVGCNLSVRREAITRAGGIDSRFLPPFNMWEAEACLRINSLGYTTTFSAQAHVDHLLAPSGGVGNRRPTLRRHYGSMFNTFLVACKHPDVVDLREAFVFRCGGNPAKIPVGLLALMHLSLISQDGCGIQRLWSPLKG